MSNTFDPIDNTSNNEHFQEVLDKAFSNPSRRNILRGGLGLASMFALPMLPGCGGSTTASNALPALASNTLLKFTPVDKSLLDQIMVPAGYTVKVLHATGDTLKADVPAYSNAGTDEAESWANRVGDQHDGTEIFYIGSNGKSKGSYSYAAGDKAVLAVNNESSAEAHFFHPTGQTSGGVSGKKFSQFGEWDVKARPGSEAIKEILMHGVTLTEVNLDASGKPTGYNATSPLNRRITPETVMTVTGPAAELANLKAMMVTKFDPTGATTRGTLNNCGTGITPWGTLLTTEENWATYFTMPAGSTAPTDKKLIASRTRYGVQTTATSATATASRTQGWHTVTDTPDTAFRFSRWNVAASGASAAADFRNEPQTFGFMVEIDPANVNAAPSKRMSMGRFAHEAAVCGVPVVGKPLAFYMGCDSRNEYIYKFVSAKNWDAADIGGGIAAGDKYLCEGKLYAAKFDETGKGEWLELNINNSKIKVDAFGFSSQAEVLVHTRIAADAAGATKMDRPEWGAVNHANGEIYFALTNNSSANRTPGKTDAANPRAYMDLDGKNGTGNPNGHIIRFKETSNMAEATTFAWDIFLFGAEEDAPKGDVNISGLTAANSFSSPDGLWFSKSTGICWIQTDDGAFTDETNCMLVAAVPGAVGDGGAFTVANTMITSGTAKTEVQRTFVGGILGESRLRRFLVGPVGAEVTGITETPDGKAIFVGIQHPGENATDYKDTKNGVWPTNAANGAGGAYGAGSRPRSATIVITKDDGGKIGL